MKGGVRKGAGRKAGSGKTVMMSFRIDRGLVDRLRTEIGPGHMTAFIETAIRDALIDRIIAQYQSQAPAPSQRSSVCAPGSK